MKLCTGQFNAGQAGNVMKFTAMHCVDWCRSGSGVQCKVTLKVTGINLSICQLDSHTKFYLLN